jgi:hypothetical protein
MEYSSRGHNSEELRKNIDHAQHWIVSGKEHPRPSHVQPNLKEEQAQSQLPRGRVRWQPQDTPLLAVA